MQDPTNLTNCHRTGNPGGKKKPKPYKVADVELSSPKTDPQGMYTGIPADPDDEPSRTQTTSDQFRFGRVRFTSLLI